MRTTLWNYFIQFLFLLIFLNLKKITFFKESLNTFK